MTISVKSSTNTVAAAQAPAEKARALIAQVTGFRDCPQDVLDELVGASRLRAVQRGEFVARRGDRTDKAGMVVEGMLEASVLRADGHRHLVGLLMPGDFFGLIGIIDGQGQVNDSIARRESLLLLMPGELLRRLRAREPSLVLACERQLALRSRMLYERLAADPGVPLEARVAGMLLMLADQYGREGAGTVSFDVKLSQTDLADWLGMSRQRVNFMLKQLEAEGLISLRYSSVTILDKAGLAARAQD